MQISTDGLVIREMNVSDNDKLVTILTRHHGIIRAFAKGAKSIRNKNNISTQLLSYSEFIIYKTRDSYIIDDARLREMFFNLRDDVEKLALAQYFCELSMCLSPEPDESEMFLRLILNALFYLSNDKLDKDLIKSVVEMRLMALSGYMPDLVCCKECSKYEDEFMFFSVTRGFLYCKDCFEKNDVYARKVNFGALTALRHSIYSEFNNIFSFKVSEKSKEVFLNVSEMYVLSKLERNFKSLEFYKQIRSS